MLKKILSLVVCAILFGSAGIVTKAESAVSPEDYIIAASASDSEMQPYYDYANTVTASISNSSGKAQCIADIVGYSGTTTKIKITMTLQKKTLLWWSEVEEWTTTVSSYKATLSKTATVDSGNHRVKVEAVVYSGSKSETITTYSSTYDF